jgi:hypothetical protein
MNNIIDANSTETTESETMTDPSDPFAPTKTEGPTLTLSVAGVLPIETPDDETKIGLALMIDGTVRWVSLNDDTDGNL